MAVRKLKSCKIYWDAQDPSNEGWAYSAYYDDGHEESGEWDWIEPDPTESEFAESVVQLAAECGVVIEAGDVAMELHVDGGYAMWTA